MNPNDTTAVNPKPAPKRIPTLFPDPMNPHSLYNPNEDPRKQDEPDAEPSRS